jgi:low affinity Fe/Cu permease
MTVPLVPYVNIFTYTYMVYIGVSVCVSVIIRSMFIQKK